MKARPYKVGFLLLPEFSYFGLVAAVQPLFLANWRAQEARFSWQKLSLDGTPVRASNGSAVAVDSALSARQHLDVLLVLACFDPKQHVGQVRLRTALARAAAAGTEIGGIETGSEVLADAGLLDGHAAAVHWENLDGFRERYPRVNAREQIFTAERGRMTCAGGTTVIELMLHLVRREAGRSLAEEVAQEMLLGRPRPAVQRQLHAGTPGSGDGDGVVRAAVELMKRHLDEPLPGDELARRLKVSARHLRRHFRRGTGTTTSGYYLGLRLSRAHNLLEQTDLSVTEIAQTSGFGSLEHFSRVYRKTFGCAPSRDRHQTLTAPLYRRAPRPRSPAPTKG
ncbi:MAG: GlxA family transcriptional regulator [Proteobacteria bacterium]|nr:GlxA family transcriptional regulator [Pseudomonadota bacterium]